MARAKTAARLHFFDVHRGVGGPVGVCKDAPAPSKPPSPRSSSGSPPSGPTTPPGPSPFPGPVPDNLRLPAEATDVYTDKEGLELLSRSLEGHSEASFRLGMPRPREAIFSPDAPFRDRGQKKTI